MANEHGYVSSEDLPNMINYILIHTERCDQRTMWLYMSKTGDEGIVSLSYRVSPDLVSWSGTLEKSVGTLTIFKYPKAIMKLERIMKIKHIKDKIHQTVL